jgi:putative tryptophan/tyrosine transport system substrate-binding protein
MLETTMQRREFITLVGGAAVAIPIAARAQQPLGNMRRIGALILQKEGDEQGSAARASFEQGLTKLGWTVGHNLEIDYRWGVNDPKSARLAVVEMLALAPDVILAVGTQAVAAAQQSTRTIPIVFAAVSEPVSQGFVPSLAHPGGNITGFTNLEPTVAAKWIELLKEIAPKTSHVTMIFNPEAAPNAALFYRSAEIAGKKLAIETVMAPIHEPAEIEASVIKAARETGGGIIIPPDSFMSSRFKLIVELVTRHGVPAIFQFKYFAVEGGLASYGIDLPDLYRRSASYVDRILRGEKPADLPVQQPTKFQLVINLRTARTLGLAVPSTLLATADEVIE